MRKVLLAFAVLVGVIVVAVGGFALKIHLTGMPSYPVNPPDIQVEVTPEKVARGKQIANMLCVECHFNRETGRLTGQRMFDLPPEFGVAYSRNLTHDREVGIGDWTDGELIYLLRTGIKRDGRYSPPWMVKLPFVDDRDIESIVAFLRSDDSLVLASKVEPAPPEPSFLAKFLATAVFKPFEYPKVPQVAPPRSDKVAYGEYVANKFLGCYTCHSADFKTMNELDPPKSGGFYGGGNVMKDMEGNSVVTPNITPDSHTGIGGWTEDDFVKAVHKGIRPDGTPLRYPMPRYAELEEEELRAVYAYLKTVPPLNHPIERTLPDMTQSLSDGKAIYQKYACNSCHGSNGIGLGDLTQTAKTLPTDSLLQNWIEHAQDIKPGTKMPSYAGIIRTEEFVPLMAYVRKLGQAAHP